MPSKLVLQALPKTPPFNPNAIAGIYGWWSADQDVVAPGGIVASVGDRSPNGRNLTVHMNAPTLIDIGGGLKAFDLDGTQGLTRAGQSLTTEQCSVFACITMPVDAPPSQGYGSIFNWGNGGVNYGTLFAIKTTAGSWPITGGGSAPLNPGDIFGCGNGNGQGNDSIIVGPSGATIGSGTPIVVATRMDKSVTPFVADVSANGVIKNNVPPTPSLSSLNETGDIYIGGASYAGNFKGQIREVIAYDSYLSDTDYAAVQTYLKTKYGIA